MPSEDCAAAGYRHSTYADSFREWGTPCNLPRSGGWVLVRPIGDREDRDAMGLYPILVCRDWSRLREDLAELSHLVCLSAVTDPLGEYDASLLSNCFPDIHAPFKAHFVIDLNRKASEFVVAHHRRNAAKALAAIDVAYVEHAAAWLPDWIRMYDVLTTRHHIRGLTAFSPTAFEHQLRTPGLVAFRAARHGETVGMLLWYVEGDQAWYHLGAYSPLGYEVGASFGLFWHAIEHFHAAGLRRLSLGAGAGVSSGGTDGLTRFKRGWATGTRTAYFCGRVFDRCRYERLTAEQGRPAATYFPAYREGEFA